jgi:hypothetical protein
MSTKPTEDTKTVEQQEERLYRTCLDKLQGYFDDKVDGGDEVVTAIKTANMLTKREQTRGAREAVRFAMAQVVCKTPEELARYVSTTQPEIKKLTSA